MSKRDKYDYFDAFSRQVSCASRASGELVRMLSDYHAAEPGWLEESMRALHAIENEGDEIAHDIIMHLAVEFIAPIDREDVSELTQCFDDVTDGIDDIVQHLYMYNLTELHPAVIPMVQVLDDEVSALLDAVSVFRDFKKPKKLARLLEAVHDRESDADEKYMQAKRDLFVNHADAPVTFILGWNSMFSHIEDTCDVCERAASIMQTITLKNT